MSPLWASLLDLPSEILLIILENVSGSDLVSLSLSSRRLHHLALPLYLRTRDVGWTSSTQSCGVFIQNNSTSEDLLVAMRSALFLKSISRLEFTMVDYPREYYRLRELERLVSNTSLLHISEFTLDLSNINLAKYWGGRPPNHTLGCFPRTLNQIFRGITREISRKSCKVLTICNGRSISMEDMGGMRVETLNPLWCRMRYQSSPTRWRLLHSLLRVSPFSNMTYSPYGATPFDLFPLTTLNTLNLRSPVISFGPFLYWIVASINSSPITVLSFVKIHISTPAWSRLLHCLTIPTLRSLTVASSTLLITDLTSFVSRHTGLTHLNLCQSELCVKDGLHRNDPSSTLSYFAACPQHDNFALRPYLELSYPLSPPPPRISFKHDHLTSLSATPEHVAYLLAMKSRSGGSLLSNAKSIFIETTSYAPSPSPLDCALDMISKSQLKDISLTLQIGMTYFTSWCWAIVELEGSPIGRDYWGSLHCVKGLHIETAGDWPIEPSARPAIPRWLAILPSIEQVTFSTPCFWWMTDDERGTLQAEIASLCPRVQQIQV